MPSKARARRQLKSRTKEAERSAAKATNDSEAQPSASRRRDNSLCCESGEVFYRDFLADRLSYLLHLLNVVHGIHLLNMLGI